jgi:hypothetical protein
MSISLLQRVITLTLALVLAAPLTLAQTQQKPLDDKDNPLLIGKRDINNNQINFYSLNKEAAIGRQLAAEVEKEAKFVTGAATERPTLKRGEPAVEGADQEQTTKERPTLKRQSTTTGDPDDKF